MRSAIWTTWRPCLNNLRRQHAVPLISPRCNAHVPTFNSAVSASTFDISNRYCSITRSRNNEINDTYIALGSNLGNRLSTIEQACRALDKHPQINVTRTSLLYETAPWGDVVDQPSFLNGVATINTDLEPHALLDVLQDIEQKHERTRHIRWGPRTLDLDLLLYRDQIIQTSRLAVPHPRIQEREFVLRPFCDLSPGTVIPNTSKSIQQHLDALPEHDKTMASHLALTPANKIAATSPTRPTQIMSILNVTPDSFSDGGLHHDLPIGKLEMIIESHVQQGATIIDIGGQSTRPGAPEVTTQVEIDRVLPAIEATKRVCNSLDRQDIAISVDTYRAAVAKAALEAGAHLINDVSAGRLDEEMLPTIAEYDRPVVLMHMRGDPKTMSKSRHTSYHGDLIHTIAHELTDRVREAEEAGIRRWQIILDPGIGFAKTQVQNLEILRRFAELRASEGLEGLPWVLGASRKKFIGTITGVEAAGERDWGTAATVAAAVQGGADIVRVHAVKEMKMVKDMSQAIWRV